MENGKPANGSVLSIKKLIWPRALVQKVDAIQSDEESDGTWVTRVSRTQSLTVV